MAIRVEGLDKLTRELRQFGEKGKTIVKRESDISGSTIERNAINAAPASLGGQPLNIKQRIDKIVLKGGFSIIVGVQGTQDLDAYIELGTGLNFLSIVSARPQDYTPEILDLARQFYKNGQGTLRGTPYLFPAYFNEAPKLIENLKRELDTLAKQI